MLKSNPISLCSIKWWMCVPSLHTNEARVTGGGVTVASVGGLSCYRDAGPVLTSWAQSWPRPGNLSPNPRCVSLIPSLPRVPVIVFCQYWGFYVQGLGLGETRRGHRQRTLRESYYLAAPATRTPRVPAFHWSPLPHAGLWLAGEGSPRWHSHSLTPSPPLLLCQDLNRKCSSTWLRCLVQAPAPVKSRSSKNHTSASGP